MDGTLTHSYMLEREREGENGRENERKKIHLGEARVMYELK